MQPIIKIENLSKQYRLGTIGTGTISNDLKRWWHKARGKEDPFLKIGENNDRSVKGSSEYVWALRDINLEVMPGEVLGIIGKNGAGKSTLLKILSKVTGPTTGSISFNGRIGSLLEVGTGFHPELTGRENIYLNGAILGMTKTEIKSKLDEIIYFSGCERYIDTPVKRYSSGMTVRLGFAVAAHLEPEILVVDEVLAVGDAEFQKKAIGKMQDVSKNEGRTVLFVSHNMGSVQALCSKATILEDGEIKNYGNVEEMVSDYILAKKNSSDAYDQILKNDTKRNWSKEVKIISLSVQNSNGDKITSVPTGKPFKIVMDFQNNFPEKRYQLVPGISIKTFTDIPIILHHSRLVGKVFTNIPAQGKFILDIDSLPLVPGKYIMSYSLVNENKIIDTVDANIELNIIENNFYKTGEIPPPTSNILLINADWHKKS